MNIQPVTLEGRHVRLEPMQLSHAAAMCDAGLDPELWRWTNVSVATPEEMDGYIRAALALQVAGSVLPFVTVERASGRVVGSTRFLNIEPAHRRLEIGSTWVARPWQRTAVNTEAKYLMMRHAFETLGAIRVEFKTDVLNQQSRTALARLGAREEGIFRNHIIVWNGRIRDSVYFSIIDREWPAVKERLEGLLSARP
jgi:N-acetyltransferase